MLQAVNNAPRLTRAGFLAGCSQPGPVKEALIKVEHEGLTISVTATGIFFSINDKTTSLPLRHAMKSIGAAAIRVGARHRPTADSMPTTIRFDLVR